MILEHVAVYRDATKPAAGIAQLVPTALNIVWPQGEDGQILLAVKKQDGTAVNLTTILGATGKIRMAVRKHLADAAALAKEAVVTDAAAGKATITIPSALTLTLRDNTDYYYDVQLTDTAGKRWQIVPKSKFTVDPTYAKPADTYTP